MCINSLKYIYNLHKNSVQDEGLLPTNYCEQPFNDAQQFAVFYWPSLLACCFQPSWFTASRVIPTRGTQNLLLFFPKQLINTISRWETLTLELPVTMKIKLLKLKTHVSNWILNKCLVLNRSQLEPRD